MTGKGGKGEKKRMILFHYLEGTKEKGKGRKGGKDVSLAAVRLGRLSVSKKGGGRGGEKVGYTKRTAVASGKGGGGQVSRRNVVA